LVKADDDDDADDADDHYDAGHAEGEFSAASMKAEQAATGDTDAAAAGGFASFDAMMTGLHGGEDDNEEKMAMRGPRRLDLVEVNQKLEDCFGVGQV
jgi:hypothetical protein